MSNPNGSSNFGSDGLLIATLLIRPYLAGELKHYEIVSYFSAFGDVKSVRIRNETEHSYGLVNNERIHSETNTSYALVKFTRPESTAKALRLDVHIIAGCKIDVAVASDRHQDMPTLLSLNDDCIHEILSMKCLSAIDLCSLAEKCRRLKEIASRVFKVQHKECDLSSLSNYEYEPAKRILVNFGSQISDLRMLGEEHFGRNLPRKLLPSIAEYCSPKLQSLNLQYFKIPESLTAKLRPLFKNLRQLTLSNCVFDGASKELLADCGSLVEINIIQNEVSAHDAVILESTFPKLQRFACYSSDRNGMGSLGSFISRHMNLKSIETWDEVESSALQIFSGCQRLETLACRIPEDATLDLSNLGHLRELTAHCSKKNFMTKTLGLENLQFLGKLTLDHAQIDSEFVQTLPQLTRLQVLKLKFCIGQQNLHQVGDLNQLTTLEMGSLEHVDLNISLLVHRLRKLSCLRLYIDAVKLDSAKYLRIVEAIRRRPDPSQLKLCMARYQIDDYDEVSTHFARNAHLVEMIIGRW